MYATIFDAYFYSTRNESQILCCLCRYKKTLFLNTFNKYLMINNNLQLSLKYFMSYKTNIKLINFFYFYNALRCIYFFVSKYITKLNKTQLMFTTLYYTCIIWDYYKAVAINPWWLTTSKLWVYVKYTLACK